MEPIGLILIVLGVVLIASGIIADAPELAALGIISFVLGCCVLMVETEPDPDKVITIQEIDYAVNKCTSFGGLKEFRDGVIICMDKTEIKMNFQPEKKVEAE